MEQYRSKKQLWSWIKANIRLEIEIMVDVGREDIGGRDQLLEDLFLAVQRALPRCTYRHRREMLFCERYANGYLITLAAGGHRDQPAVPTTTPVPMAETSCLRSCVVRGPGSSKPTLNRYCTWRRSIIQELSAHFGPGFVDLTADDDCLAFGPRLDGIPLTEEDIENGRLMLADMNPLLIGAEEYI